MCDFDSQLESSTAVFSENLQTSEFSLNTYKLNTVTSPAFERCVQRLGVDTFDEYGQEIYRAVMTKRAFLDDRAKGACNEAGIYFFIIIYGRGKLQTERTGKHFLAHCSHCLHDMYYEQLSF